MAANRRLAVAWTETAAADLRAITEFIAADSPSAAEDLLELLERRTSRLASLPQRGRVVPELAAHGIHSYRELIVAPWRIVYRMEAGRVWVLAVLDARRNLEDLLLDRFLR